MVALPKARLIGLGSYVPKKVLSNQDLEKLVETSDEWIVSRTGMKERRIAEEGEYPSDMGAAAALKALEQAHVKPEEIDAIIVVTMTPDYLCPSTAALIQHRIGAHKAAAFDLLAACTGYLYGLSVAKAYIESGIYQHVLLVASEKMSAFVDYKDRSTCVLFGDGAAAVVVSSKGKGLAVDTLCLGADGELGQLLTIPGGGSRHPATQETVEQNLHTIKMAGREIFKHAVRRMEAAARQCLAQAGLQEQDIQWIVPHQANIRIMDAIAKQMPVSSEKVYKTVHKYGNTSASSVGIALDELLREGSLKEGDHLLLVAFGGGLTWGASILTQVSE